MAKIYLLLILAIAANADWFWGGCPSVNIQQNFELNKYLGKWYEIGRVKNVPYTASTRCGTAEYELQEDGTLKVINTCLLDSGYYPAIGTAYCEDNGTGQCYVRFSRFQPWGDYKVLETDYDNYSVVWSCSSFWLFHVEYSWILARESGYNYDPAIELLEGSTSLRLDDFVWDDNTNCPANDQLY